jgi:hypothetical protein
VTYDPICGFDKLITLKKDPSKFKETVAKK